jgi:hypothetical protein
LPWRWQRPTLPPSKETEQFRAKHEADYQRDYVTLAGLISLKDGVNTVGSAASTTIVLPKTVPPTIGRLIVTADHVRFEPAAGAPMRLQDQPVTSAIDLKSDESGSRCGR